MNSVNATFCTALTLVPLSRFQPSYIQSGVDECSQNLNNSVRHSSRRPHHKGRRRQRPKNRDAACKSSAGLWTGAGLRVRPTRVRRSAVHRQTLMHISVVLAQYYSVVLG